MQQSIFLRDVNNPIITPQVEHEWESLKVYNPTVIYENNIYHLFYRAVGSGDDWHSTIGYATSLDGLHFNRSNAPSLDRSLPIEMRGLEDPRIVKLDSTYFLCYTAYDGTTPRVCLATSSNLQDWKKYGSILPEFPFFSLGGFRMKWSSQGPEKYYLPAGIYNRTKSAAIFPRKIHGKYYMFFNEYVMWLASSIDGYHWQYEEQPVLTSREGNYFDNAFVEMGPTPIELDEGFLIFYHGVNTSYKYSLGLLLIDKNDPLKILYRSDEPVFWSEAPYEIRGLVDKLSNRDLHTHIQPNEIDAIISKTEKQEIMPQVVFCCGAVVVGDSIRIYYGAGDRFVCTAIASLSDIKKVIVS